MRTVILTLCAVLLPSLAEAQTLAPAGAPVAPGAGPVVTGGMNNTGGDRNADIARGATGASTITTDSAAGGNAQQPERRIPQGSAGGGSNSN